jgi:hypothetical protein
VDAWANPSRKFGGVHVKFQEIEVFLRVPAYVMLSEAKHLWLSALQWPKEKIRDSSPATAGSE